MSKYTVTVIDLNVPFFFGGGGIQCRVETKQISLPVPEPLDPSLYFEVLRKYIHGKHHSQIKWIMSLVPLDVTFRVT